MSMPLNARGLPDSRFTLMVYLEDCTGCGLCVEACPVSAPADPEHKAINLARASRGWPPSGANIEFFESLPIATAPASTSARAGHPVKSANRSSSSPGPAPAAARPVLKLLSQLSATV